MGKIFQKLAISIVVPCLVIYKRGRWGGRRYEEKFYRNKRELRREGRRDKRRKRESDK